MDYSRKASRRWELSWDLRKFSGFRQLWEMAEDTQGRWLEAKKGQECRNVELRALHGKTLKLNEGRVPGSRVAMEG